VRAGAVAISGRFRAATAGEAAEGGSSETDPNTGIITTIYRFDWNTISDHNGNYILPAEGTFGAPCGSYTDTDEKTTQVKNLVVSASPEYLLFDPEAQNPDDTITYGLDDAARSHGSR